MQSSTLQCNVVRRLHPFAENHQSSIPKARLALTETGSAVKMQLARASRRDLGASDASQHARADAVSRRCRPSERGLRSPITRCMRHSRLKRGFYWVSITQNQQHIRCLQPSVSSIRRLFTGFESPCRLPPGVDARALTHLRVFRPLSLDAKEGGGGGVTKLDLCDARVLPLCVADAALALAHAVRSIGCLALSV